MDIKVLFFGIIADITSLDETSFSDIKNTNALRKILVEKHPDIAKYSYLLSVNHEIIKGNKSLNDNDEVALLPPFAGG